MRSFKSLSFKAFHDGLDVFTHYRDTPVADILVYL